MSSQAAEALLERVAWLGSAQAERAAVVSLKPQNQFESTTYGELAGKALRFANYIGERPDAGDVVPLYLSRSADCIAAALGTLLAGKKFAILNRKFQLPQIEQALREAKASSLVVDGPALFALRSMAAPESTLSGARWILLRGSNFSRLHEKALLALSDAVEISSLSLSSSDLPLRLDTSGISEGAGCCLFTSGSTGAPKGVVIAAQDLAARAEAEADCFELSRNDVLLNVLPFAFDVGLNQMLSALRVGAKLVVLDSWLPADLLNAAATWSVTGISGVPSIWRGLMNAERSFDTAGAHQSLRYLTVSGGSLSDAEVQRLKERAPGVGLIKTYGQTETFRTACLLPHELDRFPQSVGRPFGNVRIHVVRDDGRPCATGETGEILHSGLGTMLGYLGEGTAEKLRPNPFLDQQDHHEEVVHTGDQGYLNEEGYLFLEGRKDAMLKIAGNRVYPDEISHQMLMIEDVIDTELVGLSDHEGETRVVAFVVLRNGSDLGAPQIARELSRRLPSYMVPQHFSFRARMPHTESGKIDRPRLVEEARALLEGAAESAGPSSLRPSLLGVQ